MGTQCSSPKPAESNAQTKAQKKFQLKNKLPNGAFLVDVRTYKNLQKEV